MHETRDLPPLLKTMSRLIDAALAVSGITIIAIVFVNAMLRFIVNMDIAWSLEIVTFLMLWATFLGCAAAAARSAHMRVTEVVALFLPPIGQRYLDIAIQITTCVILVMIIWFGAKITIRTWDQETTVLYWPVGLLYASMPVGTLLTLLFVGNDLYTLTVSSDRQEMDRKP